MTQGLQPVDTSAIPELCGRFEPVRTEIEANALSVEGSLPSDLLGAYFRNGPNPKFTPLGSYTYPLEGDAMIHGLWIEEGSPLRQPLGSDQRYGSRGAGGPLPLRRSHDSRLRGHDPPRGRPRSWLAISARPVCECDTSRGAVSPSRRGETALLDQQQARNRRPLRLRWCIAGRTLRASQDRSRDRRDDRVPL
jgi:hypothetical protein